MTDGLKAEYRTAIIDIFAANERVERAVLFGSRAMETFTPASDVDIALFGDRLTLTDQANLATAIDELPMAQRVDLLLYKTVSNDALCKHIEQHGVEWYRRAQEETEWIEATIEDIAAPSRNALVGGPFGSNLVSRDYVSEGVPVIRGQNMGSRWIAGDFVFVTPQKAKSLEANLARPGDIVVTQRGTLGQVSLVPSASFKRYLVSQSQMKVTVNREIADPLFFYYVLSSAEQQAYVRQNAIQTGVPHTNLGILRATPVPVPPLKEQRAIAHILGTLDDKIECNRRMNATLEAMARALFKSWFIDFDPVHAKVALRRHAAAPITPPLGGSRQAQGDSPPARRWGVARRHYPRRALPTARTLRQPQTDAEALLWYYIRDKQLDGYKFRRQHPIGPYIVDFACLSKKVLIELDGGHHAEQREQDEARDRFLRNEGYRVLRFWNNEVFGNCGGVLEAVRAAVQDPPPQPSAPDGLTVATPPQGGSDWSVERARAYLDGMDPGVAALFPDRFEDSELGEVPAGWGVKALPEAIDINPTRSLRKGEVAPYLDMANMPTKGHTPDTVVDRPFGSGMRFTDGDTLTARITPCLENGKTAYVDFLGKDTVGWGSTEYIVMRPKPPLPAEFAYCLARSDGFREFAIQSMTGSSGRQRVPVSALSNYLLPLPNGGKIPEVFGEIVKPLFLLASQNAEKSRTLAALRDTLLPKLISGEVRVKDMEKASEQHQ